jgi:hypothetical protein
MGKALVLAFDALMLAENIPSNIAIRHQFQLPREVFLQK